MVITLRMTHFISKWQESLLPYSARQIAAAFPGMPETTAYSWKNSHRAPSEWQRPVFLAHLEAFYGGDTATKQSPSDLPEPANPETIPTWFQNWLAKNPDACQTEPDTKPQWFLDWMADSNLDKFVLKSGIDSYAEKITEAVMSVVVEALPGLIEKLTDQEIKTEIPVDNNGEPTSNK